MNFHIDSPNPVFTRLLPNFFLRVMLSTKNSLRKTLPKVVKRQGISNVDLVRACAGILATGKVILKL